MTSLEIKTSGGIYGNVKKIIDNSIYIIPWMTDNSLMCAARRHKQKISNNKILDKEEAEADKSDHQTSVLSIIYSTTFNVGRTKGS